MKILFFEGGVEIHIPLVLKGLIVIRLVDVCDALRTKKGAQGINFQRGEGGG